eukprot:CAMPEP_0196131374 /NCGR_PEP_ID=MMETSP0910-20130528/1412_1 /TAXON_ID=49265 /ORGANISM="Thalassiosira rotula, Strain GSO102" /LENGTH=330 /DNA_ID=CAMNT_0041390839 /DNA_START=73 /DNA_END=1065 /DNA_ORIENTATION=-
MKSAISNVVCMTVLLSSSVMSSSFSSPVRFGAGRVGADRPAFLVRGGSDINVESSTVVAPPADVAAAASAPSTTTTALSASVSGGGDVEEVSDSKLGPNAPPPGLLRRLLPGFPWHQLPNYLTYIRCLSIPIFMVLCYYPVSFPNRAPVLSLIFALASITDWFDGFLARRWDITSPFGAFLDPVADKLMVSTALILLAGRYGGIVAIPSAIIMAREVGVSALREWMAQQGKRDSVKVGMQGKVKAALTMISLTIMLLVPEGVGLETVTWAKFLGPLGVGGAGNIAEGVANAGWSFMLGPSLLMLFASAIITVTSGSVYFRAALPVLLGKE